MLSYVARSSNLSPFMKATSVVVCNVKPTLAPMAVIPSSIVIPPGVERLTGESLRQIVPRLGSVKVTSGLFSSTSVRYAHTDIRVPDFSDYRRSELQDRTARNRDSHAARNSFTYLIVGGGTAAGVYSAKSVVTYLISSLSASA